MWYLLMLEELFNIKMKGPDPVPVRMKRIRVSFSAWPKTNLEIKKIRQRQDLNLCGETPRDF